MWREAHALSFEAVKNRSLVDSDLLCRFSIGIQIVLFPRTVFWSDQLHIHCTSGVGGVLTPKLEVSTFELRSRIASLDWIH